MQIAKYIPALLWVYFSVLNTYVYFLCAHLVVKLCSICVEHKTIKTFIVNQCKINLPDLNNIQWNLNSVTKCLILVLNQTPYVVSKKLVQIWRGSLHFPQWIAFYWMNCTPRVPKHGVRSTQTRGTMYHFAYKYPIFYNGVSGMWTQYGVQ